MPNKAIGRGGDKTMEILPPVSSPVYISTEEKQYKDATALSLRGHALLRIPCAQLVTERFDPFNLTMDPDLDIENVATCTTCRFKEDKSNYWTAVMYFKHANGSFMRVPQIANHFTGNPDGDPMIRKQKHGDVSPDSWALTFRCWENLEPFDPSNLPNAAPGAGMNIDSPDHKSHVAFLEGDVGADGIYQWNSTCPSTHPVRVPLVFYEIVWDTRPFNSMWPTDGTQPFVLSMGDPTGYGHHGDYLFGWEGDSLQRAMDNCLDYAGRPDGCKELTVLSDEEINSCKVPVLVDEVVEGEYLRELPGCNPLQYGPESATMVPSCTAVSTTSRPLATPAAAREALIEPAVTGFV
ncbi:hypothetical protein CC1G_12256 [Coprinopsis cinerea okayama7|uniref:DUF1996 domain-containing protein n=1 Tax=Coprinopsis cinerea (strain Okayama-7 / 130 / ATCC MYA-4618 / FGSC 9003) TaxID=240176 RepID=A8P775_COPC7|nr:hypothetical protein CC1G_12256 [Coprinopsis cinerea okayama7\|eukprot:XP_001839308.2 hypothetical protein CC1G_12256 [Coprinopsis cinerea okayama7\